MMCSPEPIKKQFKVGFSKMKNLRLLIVRNVHICGDLEYLPNALRLLDWNEYPSSSLPTTFCPQKMVALKMPQSQIILDKFLKVWLIISIYNIVFFLKLYLKICWSWIQIFFFWVVTELTIRIPKIYGFSLL